MGTFATSAAAAPAFGLSVPSTFGFGTSTGTSPAFGLGQLAAVSVGPAFGAALTAANSSGFGQSAVVTVLGASQQLATTLLLSFGQHPLQQHHCFH